MSRKSVPCARSIFLLAKIAEQCNNVLRGTMRDRGVGFIRDVIYHQNGKITTKSAFAASGGVQGLHSFYSVNRRGYKKLYNSIPQLLERKYLKAIYNCHYCSGTVDEATWTGRHGNGAGRRCRQVRPCTLKWGSP